MGKATMKATTTMAKGGTMDRYAPPFLFINHPHHDAPPPAPSTPATQQLPAMMVMKGW